mmetsp:Transcript_36793/g.92196  ORF Transcript_36793/g.92196 Transcript_36793/m.92196 type:complete len:133 (-) Transcript_36793:631-1029(-)
MGVWKASLLHGLIVRPSADEPRTQQHTDTHTHMQKPTLQTERHDTFRHATTCVDTSMHCLIVYLRSCLGHHCVFPSGHQSAFEAGRSSHLQGCGRLNHPRATRCKHTKVRNIPGKVNQKIRRLPANRCVQTC